MDLDSMERSVAKDYENPAVFGINKRAPHVPLRSYTDKKQILNYYGTLDKKTTSPRVQLLDGKSWRFRYFENPHLVPVGFENVIFEDDDWNEIAVPGMWEMQGYGVPQYLNFEYPIPIDPPFVPKENPTGCYRVAFDVAANFPGRAFLVFDGVDAAFYCWLNGMYLGYSQDSRLPAEFDITACILPGEVNTLAVQVMKWCDGTYLEDQDMWRMSGIQRSVYIVYKPKIFIADLDVLTPLQFDSDTESKLEGVGIQVRVDVASSHDMPDGDKCFVKVELLPHAYREEYLVSYPSPIVQLESPLENMWLASSRAGIPKNIRDQGYRATLQEDLTTSMGSAIKLWSAESPTCYILIARLEDSSGNLLDMEASLVGFRQTWISAGGQLLHNGKPIMIRGANRHEHDQYTGRIMTIESMKKDAALMKQYNFNAVRCSHYPNEFCWYEVCSVFGLYVVDEANIETHGFDPGLVNNPINPAWSAEWAASIIDRGIRMYHRDKNMPCIILWSLGNEAGYGPAHLAMAGYLRACDPSRPIHYEGGGSRTKATDVICPMYARVEQVRALASDLQELRPVILCEYAHSMGNSTGNVMEYWETFDSYERCQGGFIWDWADQALVSSCRDKDGRTLQYWAYGGDFGDFPNDAQFICNGVVFPDRGCKPAALEMKHVQAPIKCTLPDSCVHGETEVMIRIHSKYHFIDTSSLTFFWRILLNGASVGTYGEWTSLELGPLSPNGTVEVSLGMTYNDIWSQHFDKDDFEGVVLEIKTELPSNTIWASTGHIVSLDQLILPLNVSEEISSSPSSVVPCTVSITEDQIILQSKEGDAKYILDSKSGDLVHYSAHNVDCIADPLRPCLFRAPTDNDRGGSGGRSYAARWKSAGLNTLKPVKNSIEYKGVHNDEESFAVTCHYKLAPESSNLMAQQAVDEGVGVGEVGGAHWFAAAEDDVEDDSSTIVESSTHQATIDVQVTYRILQNGSLHSSWKIDCRHALPEKVSKGLTHSLPRVGIRFGIPAEYANATWYGLGPHECYPDRKAGAFLRQHTSPVADLHVPYVYPGECGGRSNVRWVCWNSPTSSITATGTTSSPVLTSNTPGFQMSSSFYSLEDLDRATHDFDLHKKDTIYVHLDAAHMGVGGDDSWSPSVRSDYLVPPDVYEFDIYLKPSQGTSLPHLAMPGPF